MPKIGKIKFSLSCKEVNIPNIEIDLHYDTRDDFFFFRVDDVKEYFPKAKRQNFDFRSCKTREQALNVLSFIVTTERQIKRFLRVEIKLPTEVIKDRNPKYTADKNSIQWGVEKNILKGEVSDFSKRILDDMHGVGISVHYERVVAVSAFGVVQHYEPYADWNIDENSETTYGGDSLVEWTPELELFLQNLQEQIKFVSEKAFLFFNTENHEQLNERINNGFLQLNPPTSITTQPQ